jgi:hypothetical protein
MRPTILAVSLVRLTFKPSPKLPFLEVGDDMIEGNNSFMGSANVSSRQG